MQYKSLLQDLGLGILRVIKIRSDLTLLDIIERLLNIMIKEALDLNLSHLHQLNTQSKRNTLHFLEQLEGTIPGWTEANLNQRNQKYPSMFVKLRAECQAAPGFSLNKKNILNTLGKEI